MIKNKYTKYFLTYFFIVPISCILLDLFFSVFQPDSEYGDKTNNFDFSFINQLIYLSVWTAVITSTWALVNLIHLYTKKIPNWMVSRNSFILITSLNLMIFIVYLVSFFTSSLVGFNTWYKIVKSIFEHFISPPLLILMFFVFVEDNFVSSKIYAKKYGWYNLIIPMMYLTYIFTRVIMITEFAHDQDSVFTPFPYADMNPYNQKAWFIIFAIFLLNAVLYGFGNLFNYLANLKFKIIWMKKVNKKNRF